MRLLDCCSKATFFIYTAHFIPIIDQIFDILFYIKLNDAGVLLPVRRAMLAIIIGNPIFVFIYIALVAWGYYYIKSKDEGKKSVSELLYPEWWVSG